jgi:tetratricopeptide (TPR) repeat protein
VALGDLQIELQHYDEAIGYLRRALELEPENLTARVNLGVAHRARNEWAAALKEFDLAISRNPKLAEAYYFRGTTYADQNLNDQALADARSVLALVPDSVPGRLLLASASVRLGRCPEAVSALEPLRATRPGDTELLLLLGRAYQCAGNSTRAQETTLEFAEMSKREQSERERRTQSRNLVIKGNELARSNRPIEALEALREAIEKDSGNDAAYAQLAKIYASAGRLDQARAAIDQALSTNPHNPDYRYVLGRVLAQQGQLADALTAFEQATRGNPKDADAFFQMGTIHARLADRERAEAAFKKAIELSPEDREYQAALANLRREPKE